jgi:hypothetical protein
MNRMRCGVATALASLVVAVGCAPTEQDGYIHEPEAPRAEAAQPQMPVPLVSAADSAEARARVAVRADSLRAAFGGVTTLGAREVGNLRRDRNAEQIATARRLGVRVSGEEEIERLRRQGRLIALEDSTAYWILRRMEHSEPYLTPDAHAMLVQLGRRFHARLDSLGLPRYRMRITSVLRTDNTQAELRRINPNASRTVSAHEFGTTLDVSHERFAVPPYPRSGRGGAPVAAPAVRQMEVAMLEEVGKEHARALQAELGRAITEMREQGALHVMMEDRQPVYHMTVARRFPGADR